MEEEMKDKRKIGGGSIWKKTWERCKSFSSSNGQQRRRLSSSKSISHHHHNSNSHAVIDSGDHRHVMVKSKSWSTLFPRTTTPTTPRAAASYKPIKLGLSTPKGCLSVYVGPQKQRFAIKVKYTNHPLFKMLLDEAEMEYGFHSNGPLELPCDVDVFIKVLFEMDSHNREGDDDDDDHVVGSLGCSPRARTSYRPLSPSTSFVGGLF